MAEWTIHKTLIEAAQEVFPDKNIVELVCDEAIHLPTDIKYDAVISSSVFHYSPSHSYAETVLKKMVEKTNRVVGVFMVHDADKEASFLVFRRSFSPDYDERYKGLHKLHFFKAFFSKVVSEHGLDIEFAHLPLDGFWDNGLLFDVVMYKRG